MRPKLNLLRRRLALLGLRLALLIGMMMWVTTGGAETVLFDATLGNLPSDQGWPFLSDPIGSHSVTETTGAGFTRLDTTSPITDRGGYFSEDPFLGILTHPDMRPIDRTAGYVVRFDLRIASESHTPPPAGDDNSDGLADRAGFSVIAISQDLHGIELSFWEDRIWAQDDDADSADQLFTQAESVMLDTTTELRRYDLRVQGDQYQLFAGGGVAPILDGRLRSYVNFGGSVDPYEIPSFLFFGDNTTRGEVVVDLARLSVDDFPSPCTDANALVAEIVAGTHRPFFDLTGDGLVLADDLDLWRITAGERYLGAGRVFLPGDANLDGLVDTSDFNLWNGHKFTSVAAWCQGDFNADGQVDISDFNVWNMHKFTSSAPPAGAPVPEPGTALTALLCLAWLTKTSRSGIPRRQIDDR